MIALSEQGTMFDPGPCVYMEKMAGGPHIADLLDLDRPLGETIGLVAERKGTDVGDVMVVVLDRPRHEEGIEEIRKAGGRVRLITDGDVSAALLAVAPDRPVDLLWGIGGTPEGVISAAALKCYGGGLIGRLWPRDDDERKAAVDAGYDLDACSPRTTSSRATTASSPPRASPTATCSRASATRARRAPRRSRWSCAAARARCGGSSRATTAASCAR